MERIAVAGLSLHGADVAGLERAKRLVVADEPRFARDVADALGASELVLLSTCNRLELYFAREEGHLPRREDLDTVLAVLGFEPGAPARAQFSFAAGLDCARHLLRVASSLDSLVLGESEILAQVRQAFERAQESGWTGRLLGPLFQQALQTGKEVRTRTDLAHHPVSVVSLGLAAVAERFGAARPLGAASPLGAAGPRVASGPLGAAEPRVAVIGAGKIGRLAVLGAAQAGLRIALVVNRSLAAAERLAAETGARAVALEAFRAGAEPVDAFVTATSAPGTILSAAELRALAALTPLGGPLFAVDLAVPRDLEPPAPPSELASPPLPGNAEPPAPPRDLASPPLPGNVESPAAPGEPRVVIVDLDSLRAEAGRNRELRSRAACEAEALIERKLETLARRGLGRRAAGALEELRGETRDILERELRQLSTGRLASLSEDQRRAVERWARAAFGRIEHAPLMTIRRLCENEEAPPGEGDARPGSEA